MIIKVCDFFVIFDKGTWNDWMWYYFHLFCITSITCSWVNSIISNPIKFNVWLIIFNSWWQMGDIPSSNVVHGTSDAPDALAQALQEKVFLPLSLNK